MLLLAIVAAHVAISFTAARWWLRPLMMAFDRKFSLPHCKESDFYFYCFSWSLVVAMMGAYCVWEWLIVPAYERFQKKSQESS